MALVEVSIQIGDYPATNPVVRDGAPLEIKAPGALIEPEDIQAYLTTVDPDLFTGGTAPPNWGSLLEPDQEAIKRRLDGLAFLTKPGRTAAEVTPHLFPGDPNSVKSLAKAQQTIEQAAAAVFQLELYGGDSRWGGRDLRTRGVLIMDIDWESYVTWLEPPIDPSVHPIAPATPSQLRRYRCKYETFVTAQMMADLQDPGKYVPVPRGMTPRTKADFELIT